MSINPLQMCLQKGNCSCKNVKLENGTRYILIYRRGIYLENEIVTGKIVLELSQHIIRGHSEVFINATHLLFEII